MVLSSVAFGCVVTRGNGVLYRNCPGFCGCVQGASGRYSGVALGCSLLYCDMTISMTSYGLV